MTHHAGNTLHYHGAGDTRFGHSHYFLSIMHEHDGTVDTVPTIVQPHEHNFEYEEWSYNDEKRYLVCECGVERTAGVER